MSKPVDVVSATKFWGDFLEQHMGVALNLLALVLYKLSAPGLQSWGGGRETRFVDSSPGAVKLNGM